MIRLGDEPEDLARGRLLADLLDSDGTAPVLRYPRKGLVAPATTIRPPAASRGDGTGDLDADLLVLRVADRIPEERRWLFDIAEDDPGPGGLTASAIRDIRILLASARRSAAHDLTYAFHALAGTAGELRRNPRLIAFREEAARAVSAALRARPAFSWRVALLSYNSAESVEEVVAARWRDKLRKYLVLAANPVYAAGRVSFAFRTGPEFPTSAGGGADLVLSCLPGEEEAVRSAPDGQSGRGSLPAERFGELLERLRFGKEVRMHG